MKRRLKELAILAVSLVAIGAIVVVSGVVPVKASSGHWAVTAWLLNFASDRSIAFHSQHIGVPPLDEAGMVMLGAASYRANCVFCHGHPGEAPPPVAQGMTPKPPNLKSSVADKEAQELFYIVKHGIKFAGMPAWPAQQRDDEVWPIVAFPVRFANDGQCYLSTLDRTTSGGCYLTIALLHRAQLRALPRCRRQWTCGSACSEIGWSKSRLLAECAERLPRWPTSQRYHVSHRTPLGGRPIGRNCCLLLSASSKGVESHH
jgi:mono/diheme cytochrome c family protein